MKWFSSLSLVKKTLLITSIIIVAGVLIPQHLSMPASTLFHQDDLPVFLEGRRQPPGLEKDALPQSHTIS